MRRVELRDICEFLDNRRKPVSEELRKTGPYPYFGANGQQGWIDGFLFDEPLLLLAEDGGHFNSSTQPIAYKISGKTWVNNHAHVLRPKPECDIDFLAYALSFLDVSNLVSGSTRPKLTKGNAETIQILLPQLSEQKRIAGMLAEADRLRRTRRYALELSNTFLPAAFRSLFGDFRKPTHGYPMRELGAICDVRDGTHESPTFQQTGLPLVTSKNLVSGTVDLTEVDLISEQDFQNINRRSKVDHGDILMPMIGTIGNPVLVEEEPRYAIKNVALIKFTNGSPSPFYIRQLLSGDYFNFIISRNSRGGTQKFIALGDIRAIPVPVPPPVQQHHFTALVSQHARLRVKQREALRQAELLFSSLLNQVFA